MNSKEIMSEIFKDWTAVKKSINRLANTYNNQRRKGNVSKLSNYSKSFEIKTARKNTWLLILSKAPSDDKYKGMSSINICSLIYFYGRLGLRVYRVEEEGHLTIYNGHLFTRYKERMDLNLVEPLDIVKHFFINNGYSIGKIVIREGREYNLAISKDGLILGELQEDRTWLVCKTFITKELMKSDQQVEERQLLNDLHKDIHQLLTDPNFNRSSYNHKADILKAILS